ncbi:MAG: hypothetical protein OJF50_000663 [Nitrospira sp.]|jgi:hypothetical protein|nr:hypothetical protein [Nitrospira sp.]
MTIDETRPETLATPPESYGAGEMELETIANAPIRGHCDR